MMIIRIVCVNIIIVMATSRRSCPPSQRLIARTRALHARDSRARFTRAMPNQKFTDSRNREMFCRKCSQSCLFHEIICGAARVARRAHAQRCMTRTRRMTRTLRTTRPYAAMRAVPHSFADGPETAMQLRIRRYARPRPRSLMRAFPAALRAPAPAESQGNAKAAASKSARAGAGGSEARFGGGCAADRLRRGVRRIG